MSFDVKTVNNIKVGPISGGAQENTFRSRVLFTVLWPIIYLIGMKGSGKTSAIFKILETSVSKAATVYIFCPTAKKDDNWKFIIDWLKPRVKDVHVYKDLTELQGILEGLENPPEESDDDEPECKFPGKTKAPQKPKSQENFFILDDLAEQMQKSVITHLCSNMRHYKSMVIMSAQSLKYVRPSVRDQINYWLLYPHIRSEILHEVYEAGSFRGITEATFTKMYLQATKKEYNFLYASNADGFRFNFNQKIMLSKT